MHGMNTGWGMPAFWQRTARLAGSGLTIAMLALVALSPVPAGATAGYRAINLGPLAGGLGGYATDINAAGVVVGYSAHGSGRGYHATVWKPDRGDAYRAIDLTPDLAAESTATAVNDAGLIVGNRPTSNGSGGIVWRPTGDGYRQIELAPLPGDAGSAAEDVNTQGTVIGVSVDKVHEVVRPALWRPTADGYTAVALPMAAGYTYGWPTGMDSRGEVVGWVDSADWFTGSRAVVWAPTPSQGYTMAELSTLPGGGAAMARAIQPAGLIVGQADRDGPGSEAPVLWSRGGVGGYGISMLQGPNGENHGIVEAVNSAGRMVGTSYTVTGITATLWIPTQDGYRATALGTLPTGLESEASGISATGEVVGWSSVDGNSYRMPTVWRPEP